MGALWSRGSVNLFSCAVHHKGQTKSMLYSTNYKGKDKFAIGVFLHEIYLKEIVMDSDIQTKIIWSNRPSSEFKNRFMQQLIDNLSLQYKKKFIRKFSATSHGKGVIDGIGRNVKSNVRCKVTTMKKDRPIVQESESFAEFAQKLAPSTKIKHFSDEEIANYIKTNPFRTSISVNGIFNMHVLVVDGSKTQLCKNFAYHKMGAKADINIERNEHKYSDNDEM